MAVKTLTVILGAPTLEELNEAMANDPILAANSDKDNEILRRFRDVFKWMLNVCLVFITVTCCFWIVEMILTRMSNPTAAPPSFFPFDTDTTKGFVIALFLERGCVIWIAYGHISLDILFACYFYYAAVQLKIIRSNLEDFCKSEERPGFVMLNNRLRYQYLDEVDPTIYERFIFYVKRYEKVYWYLGEVGKLFNGAISIQFYTMSFCVCLVTYKLSTTPPLSITFLFYVTFLLVLQFQAFLFCFCGEIVKYESQCVVTSAYLSNWYLLSPRFRRNFFLATIRWSKPITPRVSKIIPLSLVTLVSITRAAFNLFTVLKTTNNK